MATSEPAPLPRPLPARSESIVPVAATHIGSPRIRRIKTQRRSNSRQRYVPITAGCRGDCDNPRSTPLDTVQDWPLRTRYLARLNKYGGGLPLKHLTHLGAVGATRVLAVFAIAGSALLVGSPSSSLSAPPRTCTQRSLSPHVSSRVSMPSPIGIPRRLENSQVWRRQRSPPGCGPRPRRHPDQRL